MPAGARQAATPIRVKPWLGEGLPDRGSPMTTARPDHM